MYRADVTISQPIVQSLLFFIFCGILALLVFLAMLNVWFGLGLWLIVPVILAVFVATNCDYQIERLQEKSSQS